VVTATTIVSGALAERTHVTAYLVTAAVIAGFIYPTIARWIWHPNGWCVWWQARVV
jgi:Amt family ammonium transporter